VPLGVADGNPGVGLGAGVAAVLKGVGVATAASGGVAVGRSKRAAKPPREMLKKKTPTSAAATAAQRVGVTESKGSQTRERTSAFLASYSCGVMAPESRSWAS
jgi:hypothetical protein